MSSQIPWRSIGLGALVFCFLLVLEFPYDNVKGHLFNQLEAQTGITLQARKMRPAWGGLALSGVEVTVPIGENQLDWEAKTATFRLGLGGLFPPGLAVSLALWELKGGGDLYVRVGQSGSGVSTTIEANQVGVAQLMPVGMEALSGALMVRGRGSFDRANLARSTGDFVIELDRLTLSPQNLQGFVTPPVHAGRLQARLVVQNGSANWTRFEFGSKDSDLQGRLQGGIQLGPALARSMLNLTLHMKLSQRFRDNPQIKTLESFLMGYETAPGEFAMNWSGEAER